MTEIPPIPCDFKVGDAVTFTNDYGVEFADNRVFGFASEPHVDGDNASDPRFVYIFTDAWWFPVAASKLRHRQTPAGLGDW